MGIALDHQDGRSWWDRAVCGRGRTRVPPGRGNLHAPARRVVAPRRRTGRDAVRLVSCLLHAEKLEAQALVGVEPGGVATPRDRAVVDEDRKSTRLNSSHGSIS